MLNQINYRKGVLSYQINIAVFPFNILLVLHRRLLYGKNYFFLFNWRLFYNHAVKLHVHRFVQDKKMNQWLSGGAWAYGYAACPCPPKWEGHLAKYKRPKQPHLRFLLFCDEDPSLLTLRWLRDPPLKRLKQISQISPTVVANAAPSLKDVQVSPARWWHSRCVCVMLGEIPRWRCTQRDWLLSLREFQSCLPVLTDSFHFRERLRPSRPPVFFLPGTCEEKTAGQRIRTASEKRAHAGTMPECLAITTEKAFACPLDPTRSASLCGCERHDLIRCEWQRIGWKPFSGGFRCGSVIGLCDCPRPLAVICFTQSPTQNGWRAHPRYDEGC